MNTAFKKAGVALGLVLLGLGYIYLQSKIPAWEISPAKKKQTIETSITIHIAGAVTQPGVYQAKPTQRVLQALELAGGPLPTAQLDKLNLAQVLKEGQRIYVPEKKQKTTKTPLKKQQKISINTATKAQLQRIPGIGPVMAERIIKHRKKEGLFQTIDHLVAIKGIGPKLLQKIKQHSQL